MSTEIYTLQKVRIKIVSPFLRSNPIGHTIHTILLVIPSQTRYDFFHVCRKLYGILPPFRLVTVTVKWLYREEFSEMSSKELKIQRKLPKANVK